MLFSVSYTPKRPYFYGTARSRCTHRFTRWIKSVWRNETGLGLVEISIVLILVGVLLAGVVSRGRKMISDAQLMTTVGEISQYARAVSDFMKDTGKSGADLVNDPLVWSTILGRPASFLDSGTSIHSNEVIKTTDQGHNHSPNLSNGGVLLIEQTDGMGYLVLCKKGRRPFLTQREALFLKEKLGDDVQIFTKDGESQSRSDMNQNASALYLLKIPLD